MLNHLFLVLTLALYVTAAPLQSTPKNTEVYRLPNNTLQVQHYDINLVVTNQTFLDNDLTFTGTASIRILTLEDLNEIKLHAQLVSYESKIFKLNDINEIPHTETLNNVTDIVTLTLSSPLEAHQLYLLEFTFTGKLSTNDMYGFYRSSYFDENNNEVFLATTQFQPTHARRAFPCFDEPEFKATFTITIQHPQHLTALSNTPGTTTTDGTTSVSTTVFKETPIMSSYLIAFIVSDFECEESSVKLAGNIPHYVCSRPNTSESRKYALEVSPKLVKALEDYTAINYNTHGLKKLHQVAIPDFAAGAMENWGLITYRETYLLWDEDVSNSYKKSVGTIIAHELAHQWFGNLLTTHWWSDTFLNEGFATYFETFATAEVETDWGLEALFGVDDVQSALNADGFSSANPLSNTVNSLSEINLHFGTISYSKGGSILRMVESIMGKEEFQKGLRQYLSNNNYGLATPEKLWSSLQVEVSNPETPPLATVMANWIEKSGYPLLQVTANGNDLVISQSRFLYTPETTSDKWYVPISYIKSTDSDKFNDPSPKHWLTLDGDLTIPGGNDAKWTVLNVKQTGFYRVDYSDDLLAKIRTGLDAVNFDHIDEMNRAQIVDDLFNLARIGKRSYPFVLEFVSYLTKETSYTVWKSALNSFSLIRQRVGDENLRQALGTLILNLMDTLYTSVPFDQADSSKHVFTVKQVLAHNWACALGHPDCIAVEEFKKYVDTKQKPNPNFRSIIYCNALRQSENPTADFDFLLDEFHKTKSATEIVTIISSLGCVKDAELLNRYLTMSITENSGIRQQDALSVFSSVYSGSTEGVDIALEFLFNNHEQIEAYYKSMNAISSMFSGLSSRINKQEQITKLEQFIETVNSDSVKNAANSALQTAKSYLEWTNTLESELREHFQIDSAAGSAQIAASLMVLLLAFVFLTN